ncbi:MAG TPA: class I adenylate-forming enzyme family protein [Syntrophomonadaceae bacterium]|nr:class I adenylate-forming enzyme family protein [Syntrophomonadaceae bacterium]
MNRTENALRLLSDYLRQSARNYPDKTAFVYNDQRISYREFNEKVTILARYLLNIGVKRHDRLAYVLETQPEFFYLCMAAARIGAIVVGMGIKLMPRELQYIIENSESDYVFVAGGDKPYLNRLSKIINNCNGIKQVFVIGDNGTDLDLTSFEDIFKQDYVEFDSALAEREAQVDTDDGLVMVYTSGTTGNPKGALLTHRNIIHSSLIEDDEFKSTPEDVWLDNMPINHVGGIIVAGTAPLITSSTVVLQGIFSPKGALELIQNEKVNVWGLVPTMFTMMLNVPDYDAYDKSSIRSVHFGAAMAPKNTLEKMYATMTTNVYNCLGMTEAAGIVTLTPKGLDVDMMSKSLGKAIPEAEWKLVDKDRKVVKCGEVGEIAFRGSTIIKEYYKCPRATDESFDKDGWFYTGDLFYEDEKGLLILMGRKKEMFITGGENVYTVEVEEVISAYDKVENVAVVPVPDPVYGEIGYAFIVPKSDCQIDEADLRAYLKKKLAKYKIPSKIIFRNILPLNPTGKIAKKVLIQEIAEVLEKSTNGSAVESQSLGA